MHVDVNPGDREESCLGMMEPIGLELKKGNMIILHRCLSCHARKKNKTAKDDNPKALARVYEPGS